MTNTGKWQKFYRGVTKPRPYGDSQSYRLAAEMLADCPIVEDWGCGLGWFRQFLNPRQIYRGVDGTKSQFATIVADLTTYRSEPAGLFMRHVLEHNYDWEKILDNAVASFTQQMVLVVFTPLTRETPHRELRYEHDYDVPTLSLNYDRLIESFNGASWSEHILHSPETYYGTEHLFHLTWEMEP